MKNVVRSLVAVLTVVFMISCGGGSSPEAVAKDFLKALADQDYEKAKELGTERTGQMITFIESMAKMAKENGEEMKKTDMPEIEFDECKIDGDKAVCTYTSEGKEEKIELIKVDGEWKVDMAKENQ